MEQRALTRRRPAAIDGAARNVGRAAGWFWGAGSLLLLSSLSPVSPGLAWILPLIVGLWIATARDPRAEGPRGPARLIARALLPALAVALAPWEILLRVTDLTWLGWLKVPPVVLFIAAFGVHCGGLTARGPKLRWRVRALAGGALALTAGWYALLFEGVGQLYMDAPQRRMGLVVAAFLLALGVAARRFRTDRDASQAMYRLARVVDAAGWLASPSLRALADGASSDGSRPAPDVVGWFCPVPARQISDRDGGRRRWLDWGGGFRQRLIATHSWREQQEAILTERKRYTPWQFQTTRRETVRGWAVGIRAEANTAPARIVLEVTAAALERRAPELRVSAIHGGSARARTGDPILDRLLWIEGVPDVDARALLGGLHDLALPILHARPGSSIEGGTISLRLPARDAAGDEASLRADFEALIALAEALEARAGVSGRR